MLIVGYLAHLAAATTAILGGYMVLCIVFPSQPLWKNICRHSTYTSVYERCGFEGWRPSLTRPPAPLVHSAPMQRWAPFPDPFPDPQEKEIIPRKQNSITTRLLSNTNNQHQQAQASTSYHGVLQKKICQPAKTFYASLRPHTAMCGRREA